MNFTCMSACDVKKSREIGMLLVYCLAIPCGMAAKKTFTFGLRWDIFAP